MQKFEYLENEKSVNDYMKFQMKKKAFFIVFEGLSFGEKIDNSGHKL